MASFKEKVASVAVEQAVKYARKDFKRNAPRILNLVEKFDVKKVNRSTYAGLHKVMDDPNNNWMKFAEDLICNMDEHVLTKLVPPLMNVAINSYTKRMAAIEKYGCNVPWAILMLLSFIFNQASDYQNNNCHDHKQRRYGKRRNILKLIKQNLYMKRKCIGLSS